MNVMGLFVAATLGKEVEVRMQLRGRWYRGGGGGGGERERRKMDGEKEETEQEQQYIVPRQPSSLCPEVCPSSEQVGHIRQGFV